MNNGATLIANYSFTATLQVFGTFQYNCSTSCAIPSAVWYIGSMLKITGNNPTWPVGATYQNVTINNNTTLNTPITISGTLTLTNGIIDATTNSLTLQSNATVVGASDVSHVKGTVNKVVSGSASFIFPIGDGTYYRPIGIINPSNDTWSAQYIRNGYNNPKLVKPTDLPKIDHASSIEYWNLSPLTVGSQSKVELYWSNLSDLLYPSNAVIAHWNAINNYWENVGSVSVDSVNKKITSLNSWNSFSPFTIGSTQDDGSLPITLLYIQSKCGQQNKVEVNWATASEVNNDYFSLFRSNDGVMWKEISKIEGSRNSSQLKSYSFTDDEPTLHDTYYKLAQTDFDGKSEEFNILSIYCKFNHKRITLSPIPAKDFILINFYNEHQIVDILTVRIYDSKGQMVSVQQFETLTENNEMNVDLTQNMHRGSYFMQVMLGDEYLFTSPFIKSE